MDEAARSLVVKALREAGAALFAKESPGQYKKRTGRCPRGYHWAGDKCLELKKFGSDRKSTVAFVHLVRRQYEKAAKLAAGKPKLQRALKDEAKKPTRGKPIVSKQEFQPLSVKASDALANKMKEDFIVKLSDEEREGLVEYTNNLFEDINAALRDPTHYLTLPERYKLHDSLLKNWETTFLPERKGILKQANILAKAVARASLPTSTQVFRSHYDPALMENIHSDSAVGMELTAQQLLSTSTQRDIAESFYRETDGVNACVLVVNLPKGAKAVAVGAVTKHPDEHEVIVPPGVRLRVTKVDKDSTPPLVHVTYVSDPS